MSGFSAVDAEEINLVPFLYGAILNSQALKHGIPSPSRDIHRIITVENQADYEAMPYKPGTLIIFGHGYFTPRERIFPELKPLWMDAAQFERYRQKAEPPEPGIVEKYNCSGRLIFLTEQTGQEASS